MCLMDECHYGQAPHSVLGIQKWIRPRGSFSVKLPPWQRQITATVWVDGYHSWHQGLLQPCQNLPFLVSHIHQSMNSSLAIPLGSPVYPFVQPVLLIQVFLSSVSSAPFSSILHVFSRQSYPHQCFQPTPPLGKAPFYVSSAAFDSASFWKNKTTWHLDHSTQISH